jgi:hypothetical protein
MAITSASTSDANAPAYRLLGERGLQILGGRHRL